VYICDVAPRKLRKKSRILKKRNVKRRTSAKAQSRQIMALSRSVSSITRKQFAKIHTVWQRNMLSVETTTGGVQAYICPIPYVPGNPVGASQPGGPVAWTDNLSLSATGFTKKTVFGVAREAATSNLIYHTGGCLKWQFVTNEPTFSKYYVFLIKPKPGMADQLIKDRQFKGGTTLVPTLGAAASLTQDLDYIVHEEGLTGGTVFGAQMNPKYWTTLYSREITAGANNAGDRTQNVNYNAPGSAALTSLTARGTIKLPAGGMIKNASVASQSGTGNAAQATSWEVGYGDQENENGVFLVVINNGISLDGEAAKFGFIAHDYYKACV